MAQYVAPTNVQLGRDPDVSGQVLLEFEFPNAYKNKLKQYTVWWFYTTASGNRFRDGPESWDASYGSPTLRKKTWSYPSEAIKVQAAVQGEPENEGAFLPKVTYSPSFNIRANAFPSIPGVPDASINASGDLQCSLENINADTDSIEFQIWKEDTDKVYKTAKVKVSGTRAVSYTYNVAEGHTYKVRARAFKNSGVSSEWSEFTSTITSRPIAPTITKVSTHKNTGDTNPTAFKVHWKRSDVVADRFTIEYTTDIHAFEYEETENIQSQDTEDALTFYGLVTGLEQGNTYYVRVKAVNSSGSSDPSKVLSVVIGSEPAAPTTWSTSTNMRTEDKMKLYWVHNPTDGSSQTYAHVYFIFREEAATTYTESIYLTNTTNPETIDDTSCLTIDASEGTYTWFGTTYSFSELTAARFSLGGKLKWEVRTKGVLDNYSPWSVQRVIDIYDTPRFSFTCTSLQESSSGLSYILRSYPIDTTTSISVTDTQLPLSYHLQISAREAYRTLDVTGKYNYISKGQIVFERFYEFDINSEDVGVSHLNNNRIEYTKDISLTAGDVNLENGVAYSMKMTVTLDSSIQEKETINFRARWADDEFQVSAYIDIDQEQLTATIQPFCEEEISNQYVAISTNTESYAYTNPSWAGWYELVSGNYILSEDSNVVSGKTYYEHAKQLVDDVLLAVYRRNYDNTFTCIADNIPNDQITSVIDPHPQLTSASYRVAAQSQTTGGFVYLDYYGIVVNEKSIVIQWDDSWENYYEDDGAISVEYPYAGSMLKLPYNIDISSQNSPDVEMVEYIGRQHPVSYYGTHLGETTSWSVDIPKSDAETLSKIRELMGYMGDVYVREPSGIGFWANIKVSYNVNHCELVIPVSFEITRVEGGI